jgi:hypothetical protein
LQWVAETTLPGNSPSAPRTDDIEQAANAAYAQQQNAFNDPSRGRGFSASTSSDQYTTLTQQMGNVNLQDGEISTIWQQYPWSNDFQGLTRKLKHHVDVKCRQWLPNELL